MNIAIDTTFDVYSDTPSGRDPDSHSPTLRRYHKALWSKRLPNGKDFILSDERRDAYLYHKSGSGEFFLSSDGIGHTYQSVKRLATIVGQMPCEELDRSFRNCSTVGAYIVFPARRVNRMNTINGARGFHPSIVDRFDLTLECIRRHYQNEESPLADVLARYAEFFELFGSFRGYTDFFLLQDLVNEDGNAIRFFLPFADFRTSPLPTSLDEYKTYIHGLTAFVTARNQRIRRQQH